MADERDGTDERQARIDTMIEEFRAAQQRRLVMQGIALWKRVEAAQQATAWVVPPAPERIH